MTAREFQWGGSLAVFFREDGVYVFGDLYRFGNLGYYSVVFLVLFMVLYIIWRAILLLGLSAEENLMLLIIAGLIVIIISAYRISRKGFFRGAKVQFADDATLENLVSSGIKYRFHPWARIWFARFDGSILIYGVRDGIRGFKGFVSCKPEQIPDLRVFLSEKLGNRFHDS